MMEIFLENSGILLEKTKFMDVHYLVDLLQKRTIVEIMVLSENGLISSIYEVNAYGKVKYNFFNIKNMKNLFEFSFRYTI